MSRKYEILTKRPKLGPETRDILIGITGAALVSFLVLSAIFLQEEPIERVQRTRMLMGTFVTITVFDTLEQSEDAIETAFEKIEEVSLAASIYDENAEAYILNRDGIVHEPSHHLRNIIIMAKEFHNMSGGCFDITIAPLLKLWHFADWEEAHLLFTLDNLTSKELDGITLSEQMRGEFQKHNYSLSAYAIGTNSSFGIKVHENTFLLPKELEKELPASGVRSIGKDLEEAFEDEEVFLGDDATLKKMEGNLWNLSDGRKKYLVENRDDCLNIAVEKFGIVKGDGSLNVRSQFWDLNVERQVQEISARKKLLGNHNIVLEPDAIRFDVAGMEITLGGIAKGYAVDRAIEVLRNMGIQHGMINAGGDITVLGGKANGEKWSIALENPQDTSQFITRYSLKDGSICTSGNYQRYFDPQARVGHIMDPRTGFSVDECMSVSIIAPDCATADALATAVFVLGPVEGLKKINELDDVEGLIIESNKMIRRSEGLMEFETP